MEYSQTIKIDTGDWVHALAFTANGEYLVNGGPKGVQVWRVKDGERVAAMEVGRVWSVTVSKDGRFIAAGSRGGNVFAWDGTTFDQVFAEKIPGEPVICDVDFSPDSTRLVSADYSTDTATICDIAARQKVQTLNHRRTVYAAKYSPQGDRIATATEESVRVWDGNNGRLLVDVKLELDPRRGLLWFNNDLFLKTEDSIKQIDVSTGSTVSKWLVPRDNESCIAMPQHAHFIAYSMGANITFWDTSTHAQLALIPRTSITCPIAFYEDDWLATVVQNQKIVIKNLLISGLDIRIQSAALHAWKKGQLQKAEALLTTTPMANDAAHHVLASRALVLACLQQWDAALVNAEKSIELQSSAFGYIAKCVALVGKGDVHAACRVCDIASLLFHSDHAAILLIKAVILFMAGEHRDATSRVADLIAVRPLDPTLYVVQAYMLVLRGNLCMDSCHYARAIQSFKDARLKLGDRTKQPPLIISLISGWKFDDLAIVIQQRLCDALLLAGHTKEAGEYVLSMVDQEVNMTESVKTWLSDFIQQYLSTPESNHDVSSTTAGHSHTSHPIAPLLKEWAKIRLTSGSWKDALTVAHAFTLPRFTIYQVICEHLEMTGHVADAASCLHQMRDELAQETDSKQLNWILGCKSRYRGKLEDLGDIAMNDKKYDEAILQYTVALSLDPDTKQELLVKRSTAWVSKGEWKDALKDADEVIRLDPESPLGYERRHAALHCKGDHEHAISAYETMLSKMSESSDPDIREQSRRYISPEEKRAKIRTTIEDTIRDSPPVLIDTIHGRLCDKSEQTSAFEMTPTFTELISSITTHIDHTHIEQEVGKYFSYVTFSHKWEDNEPLFEKVMRVMVYDLERSPAHEKLQMFCRIVREAGFNWAWSDTCCINKGDNFVLQEALVSMFAWYERSAMTLIFLRGVDRLARRGALTRSIWNMRAWTLQEYHASKVVRFYTEDWTLYLGLGIYNHKDSPEIISEMEEATGISAQALMALRPGLDDIREKLRLASTRQTARVEDAAYSLLGIFSASLPITYGEGNKALGRLLAQLLTGSGDVSILAWTGGSGTFNSCLPSSITVFSQLSTTHTPPAVTTAEIGTTIAGLRSVNPTLLTTLYDQVNGLSVPLFIGRRMKLPCLTFKLGQVSVSRSRSENVFRAQTNALGIVEIKTQEDLSQLGSLYLVHPWLDFLLDRQPIGSITKTSPMEMIVHDHSVLGESPSSPSQVNTTQSALQTRAAWLVARLGRPFSGRAITSTLDASSLLPPSTVSPSERQTRVLEFIARLRRPFGALLLTPTRQNVDEYRRVAAGSLITVQVKDLTPAILDKLIQGVRMLDVL